MDRWVDRGVGVIDGQVLVLVLVRGTGCGHGYCGRASVSLTGRIGWQVLQSQGTVEGRIDWVRVRGDGQPNGENEGSTFWCLPSRRGMMLR